MNAKIRGLALVASVVLLSSCASMDRREAAVTMQPAPSKLDRDAAYMAAVERVALRRGIHVTWVNAPRRRLADAAAMPE